MLEARGGIAQAWLVATTLALQLHSLRNEDAGDPAAKLRRVGTLGYQGVELAGDQGMPASLWRDALRGAGLEVVGAHVPLDTLLGRFDPEASFHEAIGNPRIVVPDLTGEFHSTEGYCRAAVLFNHLARRLAPRGIQLLYHPHAFEFRELEDGRSGMDVLFAETDAELVGFEMDTCCIETAGFEAADYLRENATRVQIVHLREIRRRDGADAPIGQGDIDFAAVLAVARRHGWPLVVEYEGAGAFPAAKASADHLRDLMGVPA